MKTQTCSLQPKHLTPFFNITQFFFTYKRHLKCGVSAFVVLFQTVENAIFCPSSEEGSLLRELKRKVIIASEAP